MSTPAGDHAFLYELEVNVRAELTLAVTGQPEVEADGALTIESLLEEDDQRYEIGLRALSEPSRRWKTAPAQATIRKRPPAMTAPRRPGQLPEPGTGCAGIPTGPTRDSRRRSSRASCAGQ